LAAILAVIGYSLNDTIVVFDRIRENFLSTRHIDPIKIINGALNQTLSNDFMAESVNINTLDEAAAGMPIVQTTTKQTLNDVSLHSNKPFIFSFLSS
jgi:preprotein translocase subunit SecF